MLISYHQETDITFSSRGGITMKNALRVVLLILVVALSMGTTCPEKARRELPDDLPPPTYIYPPENSTGQSRTPVLIWKQYEYTDVSRYTVFIRNTVFSTVFSEETNDTFLVCTDTLEALTEYTWKIIIYNENVSVVSYLCGPEWSFTTGSGFNQPPMAPFDPDPEDGASGMTLNTTTLFWDCYDLDDDPLTYDIWLDSIIGDSVLVDENITNKWVNLVGLDPDRKYFWRVVAFDSHGDSTTSPWWGFATITAPNKPPVEPWGPYPVDDETNVPLDITLGWSCEDPEDGPITYEVAMGYSGGTLHIIGSDLDASSLEVTGLDPTTEYEWLVSATDDHYQTTSGPIWSFTTGDGTPIEEVFAVLSLGRNINYDGTTITRVDHISARFDSVYAPDGPIYPMQPGGVSCGGFDLTWQAGTKLYWYSDYMAGYFLNPGTIYTFLITEGGGVPALTTDPIAFPICAPYITSPAPFSMVSMDGFDLEWHTFCSGTIDITIMDLNADSTGVYITTEDDGAYTFTADDLLSIAPEAYQLQIVLITENRRAITAPGYDSRGWVWSRTLSTQFVYK